MLVSLCLLVCMHVPVYETVNNGGRKTRLVVPAEVVLLNS